MKKQAQHKSTSTVTHPPASGRPVLGLPVISVTVIFFILPVVGRSPAEPEKPPVLVKPMYQVDTSRYHDEVYFTCARVGYIVDVVH